jgi:Utp21 specific WD40 associated putative domain
MFDFFLCQVRCKVDTDFTQAMINCFLKAHYDAIMEDEVLVGKVKQVMDATEKSYSELEQLIDHNICMVSHFTGIQIS